MNVSQSGSFRRSSCCKQHGVHAYTHHVPLHYLHKTSKPKQLRNNCEAAISDDA